MRNICASIVHTDNHPLQGMNSCFGTVKLIVMPQGTSERRDHYFGAPVCFCGLSFWRLIFISKQKGNWTKMKRSERIIVRMAPKEVEALQDLATFEHRSLSETVRELIRAAAKAQGLWSPDQLATGQKSGG
jgi:hypothetical protein